MALSYGRHGPRNMTRHRSFLLAAAALGGLLLPAFQSPAPTAVAPATRPAVEEVEIAKVVDGDTIHVRRKGQVEKLRLLSVDTEERLGNGVQGTSTKPQTVFGEECALWAQKFFADLGKDGQPAKIGLVFPGGAEQRDVYGRLLCQVILPDGTNYELMLVKLGKSPYFNKYGNDLLDHEGFVAAQKAAQEAKLGIWDPKTNEPKAPGAPAAKRPYKELLAWWDVRAQAVDGYRKRAASTPDDVADCEDPLALGRAAGAGKDVDCFGEIDRVFDEKNGDLTVLMRSGAKEKALRVRIPVAARKRFDDLHFEDHTREFRQNYFWVKGRVKGGDRGFSMVTDEPVSWRLGGPEPAK